MKVFVRQKSGATRKINRYTRKAIGVSVNIFATMTRSSLLLISHFSVSLK